jgi:putative riboflavin transport system substrate-binding protein
VSRTYSLGAVVAIIIAVVVALSVATRGPSATPSTSPSASGSGEAAASVSASASPAGSTAPVSLSVGLGYIPSVQFAPFYRADQAGYYAAEGLRVTFQNEIDANLVPKVGQGQVDIGLADGTSVIPAVSQGIPIKYVATIYGQFPSIVLTKKDGGATDAAGLRGEKIGIPGKYGSSWIMLQALLGAANLSVDDVTVVEYPDFGQASALAQGAVDAATGFVNNEPIQLAQQGIQTNVLAVDGAVPLPGPGLIVGTSTMSSKHDAIAGFIRATLKAMNEIAADPQVGVDASIKAVPDLAKDPATQLAILQATIGAWRPAGSASTATLTGAIDTAGWDRTITTLDGMKLLAKPVTTSDVTDTTFTSGS